MQLRQAACTWARIKMYTASKACVCVNQCVVKCVAYLTLALCPYTRPQCVSQCRPGRVRRAGVAVCLQNITTAVNGNVRLARRDAIVCVCEWKR